MQFMNIKFTARFILLGLFAASCAGIGLWLFIETMDRLESVFISILVSGLGMFVFAAYLSAIADLFQSKSAQKEPADQLRPFVFTPTKKALNEQHHASQWGVYIGDESDVHNNMLHGPK